MFNDQLTRRLALLGVGAATFGGGAAARNPQPRAVPYALSDAEWRARLSPAA